MPLVLFPDVEAHLVSYLQAALNARPEPFTRGVVVDINTPNPRPARLVVIRNDGGPQLDVVRQTARVGFNVWAESDADATDLANMIRALAVDAPDGKPITKAVNQSGPTAIPDESGIPRRYVVVEFTVRGAPA